MKIGPLAVASTIALSAYPDAVLAAGIDLPRAAYVIFDKEFVERDMQALADRFRAANPDWKAWLPGPYWTPDEATARLLVASFVERLKTGKDYLGGQVLSNFSDYKIQFSGFTRHGRKYIYFLGVCSSLRNSPHIQFEARVEYIVDGGSCVFRGDYDVQNSRIENDLVGPVL